MKKLFTIFTTTLLLTALVVSCGKETQSSTQGGGICKFRVTITPPLQSGTNGGAFNYNSFSATAGAVGIGWQGSQQTSLFGSAETQEFSVTKGQNVLFNIFQFSNLYDVVCRQVKVEFIIDNAVKKTELMEIGYSKYNLTDPNNPILYCKDGLSKGLNFIVP